MSVENNVEIEEVIAVNLVFEASTQTPTNEECASPLFSPKGYHLKTTEHPIHALGNIQKMRHQGEVSFNAFSRFYSPL